MKKIILLCFILTNSQNEKEILKMFRIKHNHIIAYFIKLLPFVVSYYYFILKRTRQMQLRIIL